MKTDFEDFKEMMYDVHRALGSERERLMEQVEQLDGFMKMAEATDVLLSEIDGLKDLLARKQQENEQLSNELEERLTEVDALKAELERKQAEIDNLQLKQQLTEAEAKPPEIHNHFESGSSAQVFNDKVTGKFSKFKKWKKRDNKDSRKKKEVKKVS